LKTALLTKQQSGLLLIDTDVLVLLAASGLLEQVTLSLGYASGQLRRLSAAPHQIRKSKSFRDQFGQEVLIKVEPIVEAISEAEPPTDLILLDKLNSMDFIDEGEAQLMALAASQQASLLVTGDKRAVIALAESSAHSCIDALQGRIVPLEATLLILLVKTQACDLRKAFSSVLQHKTLRIVLSENTTSNHEKCIEAVRSYYEDLRRQSSGVLIKPFW
jgi:hypothetical protein